MQCRRGQQWRRGPPMGSEGGSAQRAAAVVALSAGALLAAIVDQLAALRLRPTGAVVTELCRYPIKSLSRETLSSVVVAAEGAFPGDREWALLRGEYLGEHDASCSRWLHKTKFHVMMLDERLSALHVAFAAGPGQRLEICDQQGAVVLDTTLASDAGRRQAEEFFVRFLGPESLNPSAEGVPLRLVRSDVEGHAFHNHSGHVGDQVVHIVNLETVRALQEKMPAQTLSPYRFRANIYIDGVEAWSEFGWIGRKITIGDVEMEARKRHFLSHLYIKCIILPRQARDKHRENSKKVPFSRRWNARRFAAPPPKSAPRQACVIWRPAFLSSHRKRSLLSRSTSLGTSDLAHT